MTFLERAEASGRGLTLKSLDRMEFPVTTTKQKYLTRQELLSASDISHPSESRWAQTQGQWVWVRFPSCETVRRIGNRPQGHQRRRGSNHHAGGSRRVSSSSSTSSADPGEPSGEPEPERLCLAVGCSSSIDHRAPQADFCSPACRKADDRARAARDALALEVWEDQAGIEPLDALEVYMQTGPDGLTLRPPRAVKKRPWRTSGRPGPVVESVGFIAGLS